MWVTGINTLKSTLKAYCARMLQGFINYFLDLNCCFYSFEGVIMSNYQKTVIKDFHKKALSIVNSIESQNVEWTLEEIKLALNEAQDDVEFFHDVDVESDLHVALNDLRIGYEVELS